MKRSIEQIAQQNEQEARKEAAIREAQDRMIEERREQIARETRDRDQERQQRYSGHHDNFSDMLDDKAREALQAFRDKLQQIHDQRELEDFRRETDLQRRQYDENRQITMHNEYRTQLVEVREVRDDRGQVEYQATRDKGTEVGTGRTMDEAARNLDAAETERQKYPLTAEERRADEDRRTAEHRAQQDAKTPPTPEVIAARERQDRSLSQLREMQDRRDAPQEIDRDDRGR